MKALSREVVQPRSWFLERVAIAVAVAALSVFATGCTDFNTPEPGHMYKCESKLVCLGGKTYIVDPANFCIGDSEDPINEYIGLALEEIVREGIDCKDPHLDDIVCEPTGNRCIAD